MGLGRADPGATLLGTDRLDDPEHGIIGAAMGSGIDFAGSLSEFSTPKIYIITEPYNPSLSLILRYLNGTLGRWNPNPLEPHRHISPNVIYQESRGDDALADPIYTQLWSSYP